MSSTGLIIITAAGFQVFRIEEELSTLYRTGYCFVAIYTSVLIHICSRLIRMYVYIPCILYDIEANNYSRIIIRSYAFHEIRKALLENILTKDLMIPKDQLISSSVGTSGRRF
jgi:hypothetical protein